MEKKHEHHFDHGFKQYALKTLRAGGARVTKPRLAVIECFEASEEPMNAKEVIEWLEKNEASIDIDTVTTYRILERFHELGLLHQVAPSGRYIACTHFKCKETHHVLLRCQSCQQVSEEHVPSELLASFFWFLEHRLSFYPKKHVFQLDGICQSCRQQN